MCWNLLISTDLQRRLQFHTSIPMLQGVQRLNYIPSESLNADTKVTMFLRNVTKKTKCVSQLYSPHIHSEKTLPRNPGDAWGFISRNTGTTEASWAKFDTFPKIHVLDKTNVFIKEKYAINYGCERDFGYRKALFVLSEEKKIKTCHTVGKWMSKSNKMFGLRKVYSQISWKYFQHLNLWQPPCTIMIDQSNKNS